MIRVLFIDDDVNLQKVFKLVLADKYSLSHAFTGSQGLAKLRQEQPDVVLLDINLPDLDGIQVLKEINARAAPPPVIMVSALQDVALVVAAIKAGACDYILKSSTGNYDQIKGAIWQAIENSGIPANLPPASPFLDNIVGESIAIKEIKHLILGYAGSTAPVLIQGESGTGKELVAAAIHQLSPRNKMPFVAVNCGAIPANLIETSLFGSEKGAFTDAVSAPGYFEKANHGTIFLDEIGEMSPEAQVKLLRVLDSREYERVGGTCKLKSDVRAVAATNRNLKEAIRLGSFREDLYYRLAVLIINLPPLRERQDDLPLLAAHLIRGLSDQQKRLTPAAVEKLKAHTWPGNVRELRNILERSLLLSREEQIQAKEILLDV